MQSPSMWSTLQVCSFVNSRVVGKHHPATDASSRLLAVCCLQVTAPVRETAAQALGLALQSMEPAGVLTVVQLLQQLRQQGSWEVRPTTCLASCCTLGDMRYALLHRIPVAAHTCLHHSIVQLPQESLHTCATL